MEVRDYLRVLKAHGWGIARTIVIVTVVAFVLTAGQKAQYAGTAKVLVTEQSSRMGLSLFDPLLPGIADQPERGLETQAQLMELGPLAQRVIDALDLKTSTSELLSRVRVTPVGTSNVVEIEARDADPVIAAKIANTMAEAYVSWSRDLKRAKILSAGSEVEQRRTEALQKMSSAEAAIAKGDRSGGRDAELASARATYSELSDSLTQLRIQAQLESGSGIVVAPASVESRPVSPNWPRNLALGAVLGLALGLGGAFAGSTLDDSIRTPKEAAAILDAPVLAKIPAGEGRDVPLPVMEHAGGPADRAYRSLRDRLDVVNHDRRIRTLLVAAAADRAAAAVAANLAALWGSSGKRVVLLECDFRQSHLDRYFNVGPGLELPEAMGTADPLRGLRQSGVDGLYVLPAGACPPNPAEVLGSDAMADLVRNLLKWADLVVIDAPPLATAAESAAIARWADAVLVVVSEGVTAREAARTSRQTIDAVGGTVAGVVVVGARPMTFGRAFGIDRQRDAR